MDLVGKICADGRIYVEQGVWRLRGGTIRKHLRGG